MIEILSREAPEFSIAERWSGFLLNVAENPDRTRLYRLTLVAGRWTFSNYLGDEPYDIHAGTVSIGDQILVDGFVHTVTARQHNTPVLVPATEVWQ